MKYPLHEYNGQMLTMLQLAELAGCTTAALHSRARTHSLADAVAMGVANRGRQFGYVPKPKPPTKPRPVAKTFEFRGQHLTIKELAKIARCRYIAMYGRLQVGDAEHAVGMGESDRARKAANKRQVVAKPRKVKKVKVRKAQPALKASKPVKPPTRKTEAINPRNVKPTVLPGFVGTRYTFTPAPGWVGEISKMREQERAPLNRAGG